MYHTTRDGDTMLISQMTDTHLKNTLDLAIKSIKECQTIIESDVKMRSNLDFISSGITPHNLKKQAEAKLKTYVEKLPFYLMEAMIRGFDYAEKIQELYGRKEAISNIGNSLSLPNVIDGDEDDYSDDDMN